MRRRQARCARAAAGTLALALALTVGTACSAPEDAPEDAAGPAPVADDLTATMQQYRFDEGTRRVKAGLTNHGERTLRVTTATIRWEGFAFPTLPLDDDPVEPTQSAAFTISHGTPRCDKPPEAPPALVATVDGRHVTVPLRERSPGLLRRLWVKACAEERLADAAAVELRVAGRTERLGGEEYLPADLLVRRSGAGPAGRALPVAVVDLGGSVLLTLQPRAGRAALPARLRPDRERLLLPLLLGSAHRCDAHALGQSSQTFLISAYVRLGRQPVQRVVLPLSVSQRAALSALVRRDCR